MCWGRSEGRGRQRRKKGSVTVTESDTKLRPKLIACLLISPANDCRSLSQNSRERNPYSSAFNFYFLSNDSNKFSKCGGELSDPLCENHVVMSEGFCNFSVLTFLPTSHHDWPAVHRWARVSIQLPFIHYTTILVIFCLNECNRRKEMPGNVQLYLPDFPIHKHQLHFWFPVRSDNTSFTVVLYEHDSASWIHRNGNYPSWDLFCVLLFLVLLWWFLIISPQSTIHC